MHQKWLRKRWSGLVLVLIMAALSPVDHAAAEPAANAAAQAQAVTAQFEGHTLNLSESWGEAHACMVAAKKTECFRTPEAMEARAGQLGLGRQQNPSGGGTATASYSYYSYSCSSPLRLFDYTWYGGRQLMFWDRGYWQNLYLYGFDNAMESYQVGACYAHLAEYTDGYGWWYPGPTYPWAGEGDMGSWRNWISSIYIE